MPNGLGNPENRASLLLLAMVDNNELRWGRYAWGKQAGQAGKNDAPFTSSPSKGYICVASWLNTEYFGS